MSKLPESARATDWRTAAACRDEDPELFFPKGEGGPWLFVIDEAKAVCRRCPAVEVCLRWALEERIEDGVWGGFSAPERHSILRRRGRRSRTKPITTATTKQPPPKTLEEAFRRRAHRTDDGHVTWDGNVTFKFQGTAHNALRLAFALGHGRDAEGPVDRLCDQVCFAAEHLIDSVLKASGALCGTRRGYHWHQRVGEPTCVPCRQANSDADNRLRRTGTTKKVAA